MIQLPRRSVTRFFIPLIDVLTLLFCIFLVLPLAQSGEESLKEQLKATQEKLEQAQNETLALHAELGSLRKQIGQADRFPPTRVLEIDSKTGVLQYYDPDLRKIRTAQDAEELLKSDRRELGVGKGELYYLILYPRDRTSEHPLNSELEQYGRWFEGVKLKYDIPGRGLIRGS